MPTDFGDPRWFLAGHIVRGIGRTWLCQAFGLSHVDPGEYQYMSAPTMATARRWIRQTLDVPVRFHEERPGLTRVYCLDKYVEQVPTWDDETETWS